MPWSKQTRADLLKRIETLESEDYDNLSRDDSDDDEAANEKLMADLSEAYRQYALGLPQFQLSRCPFCQETLEMSIDPEGPDGPWWWALCPTELPTPKYCDHFYHVHSSL